MRPDTAAIVMPATAGEAQRTTCTASDTGSFSSARRRRDGQPAVPAREDRCARIQRQSRARRGRCV